MNMAMEKSIKSEEGTLATRSELEAEIAALREEMAKLSAQMKRAATLGVGELRQRGEMALQTVSGRARDLEHQFEDTVRERPVTSLAIAAGIGFLFALLARR